MQIAPEAKTRSQALSQVIQQKIETHGGKIPFQEFMQLALYTPNLGYYSGANTKFGMAGDFITAPEISSYFSYCLARQCLQILDTLGSGVILEFGAGSGKMAADILTYLNQENCLPEKYFILEVSRDLRHRQEETLKALPPELFSKVQWLNELPQTPIVGVVLANEVLDAMPVHRFFIEANKIQEFYVTWQNEQFEFVLDNPSREELSCEVEKVQQHYLDKVNAYASEINLLLLPWLKSLGAVLQKGLVLLVDYGNPAKTYYHPQRNMGTLQCHFQHQRKDDPLSLVGLQDITADVDFTRVAEAGFAAGFDVAGFTQQAALLLNLGLLDFVTANPEQNAQQAIMLLTSPNEMGEKIKALALTKDWEDGLIGFSAHDKRHHLA